MILKKLVLGCTLIVALVSCFNGTNVPSMVKKKFAELYPKQGDVSWTAKDEVYTALFKQGDTQMMANFSKYGMWLDTRNQISEKDAPAISVAYISQFYPNDSLKNIYSVTNGEGSFYEINVKGDTTEFAVLFYRDGRLFRDDNNVLLKNFKKMYPNPTDVNWVRSDNGNFDVFFKDQGKVCKVSYSINGTWIESQTLASETEVPAVAFDYIKKNYKAAEVKGIIFVKTTESELFNIVVQLNEREYNNYFNLEGKFIKKEETGK